MQKLKRYALIKVFRPLELVGFGVVFSTILFLLFPKGKLEELLFSEKIVNLDLRIKYLESLINIEKRPEYFVALAQNYARAGNYSEAYKYLRKLENIYPQEKERILKTKYFILKAKFFSLKEESKKREIKKEIDKTLTLLARKESSLKELEWIFKESVRMNVPEAVYIAMDKLLINKEEGRSKRKELIKTAVKIALWNNRYDLAKKIIRKHILEFPEDQNYVKFMLKAALSTGDPEFASEMAQRVYERLRRGWL
ncbi:MAG: hypothetical protein DSY32_02795 [Aquifex sp.]|nr:MAG: hypothetical protein DSY32_02795 [Aquifex sp.]